MEQTLEPTYRGYVASTQDALILFEACLVNLLHHIPRRPVGPERSHLVRSGSVFIFDESASRIKRWTDGLNWSPSRIIDNFLIYRELDKPLPPETKKHVMKKGNRRPQITRPGEPYPRQSGSSSYSSITAAPSAGVFASSEMMRALVGSLDDSFEFKNSGLIKKTMSVTVSDSVHHMVSYYSIDDVMQGILESPSTSRSLGDITPRSALESNFHASIDDLNELSMAATGGQGHDMSSPNSDYYSKPMTSYATHAQPPRPIDDYSFYGYSSSMTGVQGYYESNEDGYVPLLAPIPEGSNGHMNSLSNYQPKSKIASMGTFPNYAEAHLAQHYPLIPQQQPQPQQAPAPALTTDAPLVSRPSLNYKSTNESLAAKRRRDRDGARESPDSENSLTIRNSGPHHCNWINPSTGKPCTSIFSRPYDLTPHEDTIHNVHQRFNVNYAPRRFFPEKTL